MGPQSGSCGYLADRAPERCSGQASMGPQSGSCGYSGSVARIPFGYTALQWVHSLVAVVISRRKTRDGIPVALQWVHSLVAVVIRPYGYDLRPLDGLQWVHSLVAVVITGFGCGQGREHPELQWVHSLVAVVIRTCTSAGTTAR